MESEKVTLTAEETRVINESLFNKLTAGLPPDPLIVYLEAISDGFSEAVAGRRERRAQAAWRRYHRKWLESETMQAINDFNRQQMRKDGPISKILPLIQISDEELDRVEPR